MSARQLRRLILIALWGVAQCVFLLSYVFVIRSVRVEGSVFVPDKVIISSSSLQKGEYYWSYWLLGLPQRVQRLPQLSTASVRFCPGGAVVIAVKERAAVAQAATGNSLHPWVGVTEEGIILGPADPKKVKLPKIRLCRNVPLEGAVASEPIERFMQVQGTCEKVLGSDLLEYQFDSYQSLTVTVKLLGRETPILIGDTKGFAEKDKSLYALLTTLRQEGKAIKKIDMRFSNPVVALLNPPKTSGASNAGEEAKAEDTALPDASAAEESAAAEEQAHADDPGRTAEAVPSDSGGQSEAAGADAAASPGDSVRPSADQPSDSGAAEDKDAGSSAAPPAAPQAPEADIEQYYNGSSAAS